MLGISSLLALIGLLIVMMSILLFIMQRNRNLALASFFTGLFLIFVPGAVIYLLFN